MPSTRITETGSGSAAEHARTKTSANDGRISMDEKSMMASLKHAAKSLGFLVFHNTYAIGSDRGFPDLFIAGHGAVFAFECKGPKPTIYPEQEMWIAELAAAGITAMFVFPSDYDRALAMIQDAYQEALTA
jgi:hypothetical protein